MARITVFAVGTQGDVRPFVALGRGLQQRGHQVTLCTSSHFVELIRAGGLDFAPLTADFDRLMSQEQETMEHGLNVRKVFVTMRRRLLDMARHWPDEGRQAAAGADLLVGAGSGTVLAASLGEAMGIRCLQAQLQPLTPCRDIPPMMLPPPRIPLPGLVNLGLYHLLRFATWRALSPAYDDVVRPALGLAPFPYRGPYDVVPPEQRRVLYGYSRHVVPPSPDWGAHIRVTGYWTLRSQALWTPPKALVDFLARGEKPVYVGFGSMISQDAQRLTDVALQAARQSGRRLLMATGWGGLVRPQDVDPAQVHVLQHAPHDWLFPRVATVVHHGGAGTTGAAAGAGRPSVFVPFFGDQPFWADRIRRLGAAPRALSRKTVTADQLCRALEQADGRPMRDAAAALGERIRQEDGIADAADQLERWGLV